MESSSHLPVFNSSLETKLQDDFEKSIFPEDDLNNFMGFHIDPTNFQDFDSSEDIGIGLVGGIMNNIPITLPDLGGNNNFYDQQDALTNKNMKSIKNDVGPSKDPRAPFSSIITRGNIDQPNDYDYYRYPDEFSPQPYPDVSLSSAHHSSPDELSPQPYPEVPLSSAHIHQFQPRASNTSAEAKVKVKSETETETAMPTAKALASYFAQASFYQDEHEHEEDGLPDLSASFSGSSDDTYQASHDTATKGNLPRVSTFATTASTASNFSETFPSHSPDHLDLASFGTRASTCTSAVSPNPHRRNSVTFPLNNIFDIHTYDDSNHVDFIQGQDQEVVCPSPYNDIDMDINDIHIDSHGNNSVLISSFLQHTDRNMVTDFTNAVVDEMEVTSFGHHDSRKGTRGRLPIGFPGMACRHCKGLNGRTGRYFPSSIKTISDSKKSLYAMHKHLATCVECPDEIKHRLDGLFSSHVAARKKNCRHGTQRAFFRKIWAKLHPSGV